jgi:hypothetical protein
LGSPGTGAGGAAQHANNVGLLIVGGLLILAGVAAFGISIRRRRA